jgi:hypothetical protein
MFQLKSSNPVSGGTGAISLLLLAAACSASNDPNDRDSNDTAASENVTGELRRWGRPRRPPPDATGGAGGSTSSGGSSSGGTSSGGTSSGGSSTGGTSSGGATKFSVNFKPPSAPDAAGFLQDSGDVYGARSGGFSYGWSVSHRERGEYQEVVQGFGWAFPTWSRIHMLPGATWEIAVANGSYNVFIQGACQNLVGVPQRIAAEGVMILDLVPSVGCYDTYTAYANRTVSVNDGRLTVTSEEGAAIAYIGVAPL